MREFKKTSPSLTGSFLVAHPSLLDPNFRRSLLILSANDAEAGSFGLIVNRGTDQTVGDLLRESELGPLAKVPVFMGGPVGVDQLTFASLQWSPSEHAVECRTHLPIEAARELVEEHPAAVRAFIGYAGWTKGQLETELAQKAWIVQKPRREFINPKKSALVWRDIMRDLGPVYRLLAEAPDDPSLN